MTIRTRLRDWWRGYTDLDILTAGEKTRRIARAGEWINVTDGEMRAIRAAHKARIRTIWQDWQKAKRRLRDAF